MSWSILLPLLIVLLAFIATGSALLFYLRHWAARSAGGVALLTEGQLLKRHIPPELRDHYDALRAQYRKATLFRRRTLQLWASSIVAAALTAVAAGTIWYNWDRLLPRIDLQETERALLSYTRHNWQSRSSPGMPQMAAFLPELRRRGVALLGAGTTGHSSARSIIPRANRQARQDWEQLLNRWGVRTRRCQWANARSCINDRIAIVLPGQWDFRVLDQLLAAGSDLLLYGPPAKVFSGDAGPVSWRGLRFEPAFAGSPRYMTVRGDQLLTVGIDAGLMLDMKPILPGYRVHSDSPQAFAISSNHMVGGVRSARLHAESAGEGRLVWMDYVPDPQRHDAHVIPEHLDSLNAAVFRFLLRRSYAAWATWPEGRKFAGFLSEDSEDKYRYAEAVVELARKHDFPITWFILSNAAMTNRALTREMAEVGEIACHGDSHAAFPRGDLQSQTERLARCRKVLFEITGQQPVGFRPPEEKHNGETVDAIANTGFGYYFAETGSNRAVPSVIDSGNASLVSIPRLTSDDYEMWHARQLDGESSLRLGQHEVEWMADIGGVFPFDFHTQYMDEPENLAVVEFFGRRFSQDDCWFADVQDVAYWWRTRHQLMSGEAIAASDFERYRPVMLSVGADGTLQRHQGEQDALLAMHQAHNKPQPDVPPRTLLLSFTADSWTEIYDANGTVLKYDLLKAGRTLQVRGIPPFEVQLGYWRGVRIEYDGKPVALGERSGDTARLTIGN